MLPHRLGPATITFWELQVWAHGPDSNKHQHSITLSNYLIKPSTGSCTGLMRSILAESIPVTLGS